MSIRVAEHIKTLRAYKPGKPIAEVIKEHNLRDVIKLASNENPLGPSPKAVEAMRQTLEGIHIYPNGGKSLREAIAAKFGIATEEVITGSGSEGVMTAFMRTFLEHGDEVVTSGGTFSGFTVICHAIGVKLVTAPLKNFAYDLQAIAKLITPKTRLVYLANPNNPTGSAFDRDEFETFYRTIPADTLLMHDEAYYDFAIATIPNFYSLVSDIRPNVLSLRTFSKAFGLAGIRIGFGTGPREIIEPMLKVKPPFEPSTTAQAGGLGALDDDEFLDKTIQTNLAGRSYLAKAFGELQLHYVPTAANFYCVDFKTEERATNVVAQLEHRGIIVRPLGGFDLNHCVRISIGTEEQNKRAIAALKEILAETN